MNYSFGKTYNDFYEYVSASNDELIILSPYIKFESLKLLIERVKPGIKIIVVARWKLSDLIFGSSDIEVFDYLHKLNHRLYINNQIHLKVIVRDKSEILIGSANITGSGLGLFENSNIEAIAIDSFDEKYLPQVYSILRESILVDQILVNKISEEVKLHKQDKIEQLKIIKELECVEKSLYIKLNKNILVEDFLFTSSSVALLEGVKKGDISDSLRHDLKILGLNETNLSTSSIKKAFLNTNSYMWQRENIVSNALFGKYSELLHNALVDDPKPYRKQVKELVNNMFNWTKEFSTEFEVIKHKHTSSMVRKL